MLRSMYSGISGLKNFQTKLDVIGNNISNVNTYGFKKGRVVFKDLISQTTSGASGPTGTVGGVNPKQVGLGSQIAAIDTLHTGGSLQSTGRTLDLALQGDGYFMVADAPGTIGNEIGEFSNPLYTRAGNFYMDKDGFLVNAEGKYLVGQVATETVAVTTGTTTTYETYTTAPEASAVNINTSITGNLDSTDPGFIPEISAITIAGGATGARGGLISTNPTPPTIIAAPVPIQVPIDAESMSISQSGTVTFVDKEGILRFAGQITLAKFSNTGGLEKVGGNYFKETVNSGEPFVQIASTNGLASVESGFLEMSNVDLSEEFTEMIVAQRGFQANTRIITTSDEILQELVNLKR